jgi:hypothetical protein
MQAAIVIKIAATLQNPVAAETQRTDISVSHARVEVKTHAQVLNAPQPQ